LILVSACLAGVRCRYDGEAGKIPLIEEWIEEGKAIAICPEQLGQLPTPRQRAEIKGGSGEDVLTGKAWVCTEGGNNITREFILGARRVLALTQALGIKRAVLKAKSPSCGYGIIYNGDFSGELVTGKGVTSALLEQHGIEIFTEENLIDLGEGETKNAFNGGRD